MRTPSGCCSQVRTVGGNCRSSKMGSCRRLARRAVVCRPQQRCVRGGHRPGSQAAQVQPTGARARRCLRRQCDRRAWLHARTFVGGANGERLGRARGRPRAGIAVLVPGRDDGEDPLLLCGEDGVVDRLQRARAAERHAGHHIPSFRKAARVPLLDDEVEGEQHVAKGAGTVVIEDLDRHHARGRALVHTPPVVRERGEGNAAAAMERRSRTRTRDCQRVSPRPRPARTRTVLSSFGASHALHARREHAVRDARRSARSCRRHVRAVGVVVPRAAVLRARRRVRALANVARARIVGVPRTHAPARPAGSERVDGPGDCFHRDGSGFRSHS